MSNLLLIIPNLGEIRHFDTLNTQKKFLILISGCFRNLSFSHGGIVEEFKEERDNFVTINEILKFINLIMTIPSLG